jgi:pimeloyl-ACP methyl ester carboxylesterase
MTLPTVNPREIILWGMSMGAALSGVAATIDTRIAALIMVCPLFSYIRADKRRTLFQKLMKDRQSQLRGNAPFELPPFNSKGENPAGFAGSGGAGGKEAALLMRSAIEHGHPNFRDRITLQSYHKLALFRPKELLRDLLQVPTLMVIPELDDISLPADQQEVYDSLSGPKKLYWARGAGHMSILSAKDSVNIRKEMLGFLDSARRSEVA